MDRVQDVFQFDIVLFFCLLGVLPWQKADRTDPNFQDFCSWREKRSSKVTSDWELTPRPTNSSDRLKLQTENKIPPHYINAPFVILHSRSLATMSS